ncbi:cobaltochelatase CobT-related protein [Qipengyuania sp.]|uniref:cobaltochelatase CobT-related protein n=1 Tax=Qipengyuania sp. TaxID=2004515 RepID=UPI003AF48686
MLLFLWWLGSLRKARQRTVALDWPEQPYSVFSTEFDCEVRGRDIPDLLESDCLVGVSWNGEVGQDLDERVRESCIAFQARAEDLTFERAPSPDQAICFLIDLSGSMADRLPKVLGELRALHDWLSLHGVGTAVYGYTTRGWKGGLVREKWLADGCSSYPGRLCALLHVIVSDFGIAPSDDDWDALLRADLLHENIDGEALRWASSRLLDQGNKPLKLFVLSDGAPVDDPTIMANGNGFLWRDIVAAIDEIETDSKIELVGIGLDYRVSEFYQRSEFVGGGGSVVQAILPHLDSMVQGDA